MDEPAETKFCTNCKRNIAIANFLMHEVHCRRNIILCKHCQEPVPKTDLESHYEEYHVKVKCKMCQREFEKEKLEKHEKEECSQRPVHCSYCDLEFPKEELEKHQDFCGSRTELCLTCNQYIMLKDMEVHQDSMCNYPEQPVTKPTRNFNQNGYGDDDFVDVPPAYLNSFAMNEVGRILNPTGLMSYGGYPSAHYQHYMPSTSTASINATEMTRRGQASVNINVPARNGKGKTAQEKKSSNVKNTTATRIHQKVEDPNILARHLAHDLSPDDDDFLTGEDFGFLPQDTDEFNDGTALPCEFCDHLIPIDVLMEHQTGCNPEVSYAPPRSRDPPASQNNMSSVTANHPPRSPPYVVNNLRSENSRLNDEYNFSSDGSEVELPCEFCEKLFPMDLLFQHQPSCQMNPLQTPRTMTPAVPKNQDRVRPKELSHASKRQQEFQTLLEARLVNMNIDGEESPLEKRIKASSTENAQKTKTKLTNKTRMQDSKATPFYSSSSTKQSNSGTNNTETPSLLHRKGSAERTQRTLNDLLQNPTGSARPVLGTYPNLHSKESSGEPAASSIRSVRSKNETSSRKNDKDSIGTWMRSSNVEDEMSKYTPSVRPQNGAPNRRQRPSSRSISTVESNTNNSTGTRANERGKKPSNIKSKRL